MISSSLVVPFVTMSATTSAKQDDIVMLQNYSKNNEKLISYLKGKDIEKLSSQAKSNREILNWIVKTKYKRTNSINEDIKTLNKLNIILDLKLFMLQNLMDKFNFFLQQKNMEDTKGPKGRWLQAEKKSYPYKTPNTYYVYANSSKREGLLHYNNSPIRNLGRDYIHTKDYVFSTDVSRIGWSTDYIVRQKIISDINRNKILFNYYNRQIKEAMNDPLISELMNKENTNLEKLLEHIQQGKSYVDSGVGRKEFNKLRTMISAIEGITRFMDGLNLGLKTFSNIKQAVAGPIAKASNIAYTLYLMFEGSIDLLNGKPIDKSLFKIGIGATALGVGLATGLIGPAIFATSVIFTLLENIELGNGFSIWDNWNDHGLNDWHFQMKNNSDTMFEIARRYSNGYTQPVEWKVTDGWFSFPELYIKTGQSSSDSNFVHLSPGTSFNFGNKISL